MKNNHDMLSSILKTTQMGQIGIRSVLQMPMSDSLKEALESQLKEYDAIETQAHNIAASRNLELSELDPALWGGILDLDGIASWSKDNITTFQEQYRLMYMMNRLNGLLLIQTIIKDARNWRNRHE